MYGAVVIMVNYLKIFLQDISKSFDQDQGISVDAFQWYTCYLQTTFFTEYAVCAYRSVFFAVMYNSMYYWLSDLWFC